MSRNESLDCCDFEDRIHQVLDDRLMLTGDDLLMAHVARCPECEKVFNEYNSVDDSIKLLPADLAEILDQHSAPRRNGIVSHGVAWAIAVAATVVIAINVFHASQNTSAPSAVQVAKATAAPLAIALPGKRFEIAELPKQKRTTPDSSPFSRKFSVASAMPTLPVVPTWSEISQRIEIESGLIEPVFSYSAKIPAIRPVHCSLNATISVIKHSLIKSDEQKKPDLGLSLDPTILAAV